MRRSWLIALMMLPALSGCIEDSSFIQGFGFDGAGCDDSQPQTWYLGPGNALMSTLVESGATPGNGFNEAFLSNDMDEWHGPFAEYTYLITGTIDLHFWAQGNNGPAPVIVGGEPGEGYAFFNQLGTNRGFMESYVVEYESAAPNSDVRFYHHSFDAPEGGVMVEKGDYLRLLLTNLVLDDAFGAGPSILWGQDHPSSISFEVTCKPTPRYPSGFSDEAAVFIPANQGLLTGAVPETQGVNFQEIPFTLRAETDRLTIAIETTRPQDPKRDIDLVVLDDEGNANWGIGSPYTDEVGTRWSANLDATMPPGDYVVRVNAYSGADYFGFVTIDQEVRA